MPTQRYEHIIIHEPETPVKACIIWLHGLGASGDDFLEMPKLFPVDDFGIRMIFPHAPVMPVTVNMGMEMRAWYDIKTLDGDLQDRSQDQTGIALSKSLIDALIDEQVNQGIAPDKIFIFGFSQGGAMSLHVGTRYPQKLAGIVGLSCYLLDPEGHEAQRHDANLNTPIWLAHGTFDPVVKVDFGRKSESLLTQAGHDVSWTEYPMEHTLCMPEIQALISWTEQRLKTTS